MKAKRVIAVNAILTAVLAACGTTNSEDATSSGSEKGSPSRSFADPEAWIAYQTDRGGHEGVWLVHPDGSGDHEIALDVPGDRLHPDWSPDGSQLVITSRTERDVLYTYDVDADAARVVWDCAAPCVGDDEAVWAPDGERIAFVRAKEPFVDGVPSCALFIGSVESGTVEQLGETVSCLARPTFPHWSRDGSKIAYYRGVYEAESTESTAIHVLDVESRSEAKVTDDAVFAGDSDWSADGEWLTFSTYPLNDFQCCEVSNLYRVHPDGSGLEQITSYDTADLRATQPRYTPDGESIIFTSVTPGDRVPWVIPADGGEPIAVTSSGIYTHNTLQPTS